MIIPVQSAIMPVIESVVPNPRTLSYAMSRNAKLMVSYRFDGYCKALRTFDSAGNIVNVNRFFHGPMLRLAITN